MTDTTRILVADDSRTARSALVAVLRTIDGVEVTEVENGAQALKEACLGGYALVISDVEMPVMGGPQLLRILRSQHYSSTELPIIMLTNINEPSQKVRAFNDGANDYVTKPIEPQELLARVRCQLELRRLYREVLATQVLTLHAQKLAAVAQLSGAVAHELNTPSQYLCDNISFLRGAFEQVMDALSLAMSGQQITQDLSFVQKEIPQSLLDMEDGVRKISTIVQTIREFGDTGSDNLTVVDVRKTIDTVVELLRNRWLGVADVATVYDPLIRNVRCYPADIKHAIWQLLVQAADDIAARTPESTKGRIEVSVSQEEGHVFIKVRSESASMRPTPGGDDSIGDSESLRIARAVIEERHHGELTRVMSDDGWTTAIIKLPSVWPAS
jgi:two-component system, NtrC family, sensor kinase